MNNTQEKINKLMILHCTQHVTNDHNQFCFTSQSHLTIFYILELLRDHNLFHLCVLKDSTLCIFALLIIYFLFFKRIFIQFSLNNILLLVETITLFILVKYILFNFDFNTHFKGIYGFLYKLIILYAFYYFDINDMVSLY